jgi:hypothetical protein
MSLPLEAGDTRRSESGFNHRSIQWISPSGEESLSGLYMFSFSEDEMIGRVLAETPGGVHVMLTQTLDPRTGVRTTELRSGESGWTATVEMDSGVTRPTLSSYFRASAEEEAGRPVWVRLWIEGEKVFEAQITVDYPVEMHRRFVEEMAAAPWIGTVSETIPQHLRSALFFLEASLSPDMISSEAGNPDNIAHGYRDVVEILTGVVESSASGDAVELPQRWRMEVGSGVGDLPLESSSVMDLLGEFEGADPLMPFRAATESENGGEPQPPRP